MGRERMLALVLAGLMVAMAPNVFANTSEVSVESSLVEAPEKGWYGSGEVVEISAELVNDGSAISIDVDPSCNQVLKIWSDNSLILDGAENCLGQSRGMDLDAESSLTLDSLSWDLTDSNGDLVPSGDYIVEYFVAGEELSSLTNVHVQTPVNIPTGLELEMITTARDGFHAEASPSIVTIRLHNTLSEDVSLAFGNCKISLNEQLLDSCGPSSLSAHEIVTIGQYPFILTEGENTISVSLGDGVLYEEVQLVALEDSDQATSNGNLDDIQFEMVLEDNSSFGESEVFASQIAITNDGEADIYLDFTDSCRGEIWIVNAAGEVVMDSRALKDCTELDVQYMISPGNDRSYSQPEWTFIGPDGCLVSPGEMMVVMEIPEHDMFDTSSIDFSRARSSNCESETLEIIAEVSGDTILTVSPKMVSDDVDDIFWLSACGLETKLIGPDGEIDMVLSQCDEESVVKRFTTLNLESIEFDMESLEEGEYTLLFESISDPLVQSTMDFNWPIVEEEIIEDEEIEEIEEVVSRVITGTWSSTNTEFGTCWLLNTPSEGIITLSGAPTLMNWLPQIGATGQYLIHDSEAAPQCSDFATTAFVVEEVYSQEIPVTNEESQEEAVLSPVEAEDVEISPVVVTVTSVVVGGGLLSLLVGLIATNESWRIPTTSAGLWLLGLVGRTSETSDGRYQRGRLMGYLTANPGCHFRALMAALEMSNGQITHHLKVLENEERIWRRPDGRLVRFYPFTTNLHPGLIEEDLPLPPLSPDPNSLQGKILRLLDEDGSMKKYPTQSELAHRLERSQQLVSHHLRTLHKFGLVEKHKSGVRNRYRLTREAVFLLDTTEL
jgi:DNA-binding MarR family transcriptional regulator